MKITKYAQSCFLLETKGKRILIDPGVFCYSDEFTYDDWKDIDFLLLTHRHGDHALPEAVQTIVKNNDGIRVFCNEEVANHVGVPCEIANTKDIIESDGIKFEVVKAVHGYMPFLKGNLAIHQNNGFIIDDGETRVYQCSDTICFENDFKADVVLAPICNHGLVMNPKVAALFCKEINPKLAIPMHYDNPKFPMDPELFGKAATEAGLAFKVLKNGEAITV